MTSALLPVVAEILPLIVGVALSPFPIIASVVVALSPRGVTRAVALLAGRLLGVAAVVAVVTALAEYVAELGAAPTQGLEWVKVVLGLLLMVFGVVKWIKRPRGDAAEAPPKWMASLETISAPGAFGLGVAASVANPKELAFGFGAGLAIGTALTEWWPSVAAVAIFAVLACLTVVLPPAAVLIGGERAKPALADTRRWLIRNTAPVTAIVLLFFGAVLVSNGFA